MKKQKFFTWKKKVLLGCVLFTVGFSTVMIKTRDNDKRTYKNWWACVGDQWELGRETNYSIIFNSCVIDSGRKDANGEVIWVKAGNDRGLGDGEM